MQFTLRIDRDADVGWVIDLITTQQNCFLAGKKVLPKYNNIFIYPYRNFCTTLQKFTYDARPVHFDNDELSQTPRPLSLES
jgi:hypothetical protein